MPIWKNRSGNALAKMCMSVYLPRSAVRPTIRESASAALTSACPNGGAEVVFWPGSAKDAIMAEVFSFGLAVEAAADEAAAPAAVVIVLMLKPSLRILRSTVRGRSATRFLRCA